MNYLVIYPGRFHLFHLGHKGVYDYLSRKYTPLGGQVKIATSEKQDTATSPFSYGDKVAMLTKMGVPASHILKVSNPYSIDEYKNTPDASNTVLIFAVGAKDQQLIKDSTGKVIQRPRFTFQPRKDGTPSAIQPLPEDLKDCRPVSDGVAYVDVVNTIPFKVLGQNADSASQVRKLYADSNDADRMRIINDLYGSPDAELKDIFDQRLGVNEPQETITYGKEKIYAGEMPVTIMREERLASLRENIEFLQKRIKKIKDSLDYLDEKWTRKYKKSINCANPRGFSQKAHCAARRKRARGGSTKSKPV